MMDVKEYDFFGVTVRPVPWMPEGWWLVDAGGESFLVVKPDGTYLEVQKTYREVPSWT